MKKAEESCAHNELTKLHRLRMMITLLIRSTLVGPSATRRISTRSAIAHRRRKTGKAFPVCGMRCGAHLPENEGRGEGGKEREREREPMKAMLVCCTASLALGLKHVAHVLPMLVIVAVSLISHMQDNGKKSDRKRHSPPCGMERQHVQSVDGSTERNYLTSISRTLSSETAA